MLGDLLHHVPVLTELPAFDAEEIDDRMLLAVSVPQGMHRDVRPVLKHRMNCEAIVGYGPDHLEECQET